MVLFLGLGGGSDLATCYLVARSMKVEEASFITVFRPLIVDNTIDIRNSVRKYTGAAYMQKDEHHAGRTEYADFVEVQHSAHGVHFRHRRDFNTIGILLLDAGEPSEELLQYTHELVRGLYEADCDKKLVAVDTGGDSLRDIVPGMGDRDISHLFDGSADNRDSDALRLAAEVTGVPVTLYVVGPGSDGETSLNGLTTANRWLSTKPHPSESSINLINRGPISTLSRYFPFIQQWSDPSPGSTIWNIVTSLEKDTQDQVPIVRRGHELEPIPAMFLQEYWVFELCKVGIKIVH